MFDALHVDTGSGLFSTPVIGAFLAAFGFGAALINMCTDEPVRMADLVGKTASLVTRIPRGGCGPAGRRRSVRFLFVGEGPVKGDLVEQASRRGLGNVVFHPQVPLEDAGRYISLCDVLLVPLRRLELLDTFIPSKMFDILACAKPVILMVDGEARTVLDAAGGGVFVPAEDPGALSDAVRELRRDPELTAMGARGRDYVLANVVPDVQPEHLAVLLRASTLSREARQRAGKRRPGWPVWRSLEEDLPAANGPSTTGGTPPLAVVVGWITVLPASRR